MAIADSVRRWILVSLDSFDHHSRCNAHGHELLEEQLASVRNTDLRDLRRVLATTAFVGFLFELCNGDQAADVADVHTVWIRDFEKTLFKELCSAVGDLAIALHFSEAQTSVT